MLSKIVSWRFRELQNCIAITAKTKLFSQKYSSILLSSWLKCSDLPSTLLLSWCWPTFNAKSLALQKFTVGKRSFTLNPWPLHLIVKDLLSNLSWSEIPAKFRPVSANFWRSKVPLPAFLPQLWPRLPQAEINFTGNTRCNNTWVSCMTFNKRLCRRSSYQQHHKCNTCKKIDHEKCVLKKRMVLRKETILGAYRWYSGVRNSVEKIDSGVSNRLMQFICKFLCFPTPSKSNTSIKFSHIDNFKLKLFLFPSFFILKVWSSLLKHYIGE